MKKAEMLEGPGKYDDLCTHAMEKSDAHAVLLIVVEGNKGSGFSVQARDVDFPSQVPDLLRRVADRIETEYTGSKQN